MKRYNGAAFNQFPDDANGIAYAYAKITVRDTITGAKAQLYGDNGSSPIANPVTADGQGYYFFYVADGRYDLIINEGGTRQRAVSDEAIFDDSAASAESDDTGLELIAHRGFRDSFPQNTMLAFTSAVRRGADSLECDVQFSADGVAYVFHDSSVDALTNGTGQFNTLTSSYINGLKFDETVGTFLDEVSIPTFEQLLAYCRYTGLRLYPEIKGYRTSADIALFVSLINDYDMQERVVVQSFVFSDLEAVRSLTSIMAVGFLGGSSVPSVYQEAIDKLSVLGNGWLLWSYPTLLTYPAIKDYADSFNVKIGAYTCDNNRDAQKLMALGIRHIMSDVQLEVI